MTNEKTYAIVDSVETLEGALARLHEAQKIYAGYTQEQVDKIFHAAAIAANKARIPLAKMAVEETGMGIVEDKVVKNHFASEYIYNAYKNTKTCGVIEENTVYGTKKIAEPLGVIAAVIPTTNPTSTAIFKTLLALKTRNGIIIGPHPRAKGCTIAAAKVVLEAAVAAGNNKMADLTENMYFYRIKKYIGAYAAALGGVDIIVFTGGVGENQASCRSGACEGLEYMGVKLDLEKNKVRGEEAVISADDSKVKVVVIPTDEELMIASDTMAILNKK